MFIKVPTKEGEAVIAVQHIVSVIDLEQTEESPDRGASIRSQVRDEIYHTYTTARAHEILGMLCRSALAQVKP
jgi:hypothetical protein